MENAGNVVTSAPEKNLAARNDSYNWNNVLNEALEDHSDVSFLVSAGDQVNYLRDRVGKAAKVKERVR